MAVIFARCATTLTEGFGPAVVNRGEPFRQAGAGVDTGPGRVVATAGALFAVNHYVVQIAGLSPVIVIAVEFAIFQVIGKVGIVDQDKVAVVAARKFVNGVGNGVGFDGKEGR